MDKPGLLNYTVSSGDIFLTYPRKPPPLSDISDLLLSERVLRPFINLFRLYSYPAYSLDGYPNAN